jgi:DNA-binding IclR family transcriptional regulator
MPSNKQSRPRGVQSIEVGFRVLRALASAKGPLHLRELGGLTGMDPSKIYRYLVGFAGAGLVKQDSITGRYSLGQFCNELGLAVINRIHGLDTVAEAVHEVVAEVDCDALITVWSAFGPVVVTWRQGRDEIAIELREGVVFPILTSATGRLWARHLPAEATQSLIEAELPPLAKALGQSARSVHRHYAEMISSVDPNGLSLSESERRAGIDALSGAVMGGDKMQFAITILGLNGSSHFRTNALVQKALRAAVAIASSKLTRLQS